MSTRKPKKCEGEECLLLLYSVKHSTFRIRCITFGVRSFGVEHSERLEYVVQRLEYEVFAEKIY